MTTTTKENRTMTTTDTQTDPAQRLRDAGQAASLAHAALSHNRAACADALAEVDRLNAAIGPLAERALMTVAILGSLKKPLRTLILDALTEAEGLPVAVWVLVARTRRTAAEVEAMLAELISEGLVEQIASTPWYNLAGTG